jgi:hypothetical protein
LSSPGSVASSADAAAGSATARAGADTGGAGDGGSGTGVGTGVGISVSDVSGDFSPPNNFLRLRLTGSSSLASFHGVKGIGWSLKKVFHVKQPRKRRRRFGPNTGGTPVNDARTTSSSTQTHCSAGMTRTRGLPLWPCLGHQRPGEKGSRARHPVRNRRSRCFT